jgi:hypothetical protein
LYFHVLFGDQSEEGKRMESLGKEPADQARLSQAYRKNVCCYTLVMDVEKKATCSENGGSWASWTGVDQYAGDSCAPWRREVEKACESQASLVLSCICISKDLSVHITCIAGEHNRSGPVTWPRRSATRPVVWGLENISIIGRAVTRAERGEGQRVRRQAG